MLPRTPRTVEPFEEIISCASARIESDANDTVHPARCQAHSIG